MFFCLRISSTSKFKGSLVADILIMWANIQLPQWKLFKGHYRFHNQKFNYNSIFLVWNLDQKLNFLTTLNFSWWQKKGHLSGVQNELETTWRTPNVTAKICFKEKGMHSSLFSNFLLIKIWTKRDQPVAGVHTPSATVNSRWFGTGTHHHPPLLVADGVSHPLL